MEFSDIKLSPSRLKLTIKDIVLSPSKSSLLRSIIVSIFQSANVGSTVTNEKDFPESRITVQYLAIKIRASSLAGRTQDGDPCTTTSTHPHESIFNASSVDDGDDKNQKSQTKEEEVTKVFQFGNRLLRHLIPCPVIIVKLRNVSIEIEKAYLAPEPPEGFRRVSQINNSSLPAALQSHDHDLPAFYQESFLDSIRNEEVAEADKVTVFVERWSE